ncbi:MAG: hypothetical protein AB8B74_14060 [Crocinitomicaceae bacterium]
MRLPLLLFFASILITVSSCKKDPLSYKIEGVISDLISNEHITNVKVKLYKKVYTNNILSNNYNFISEVNTDNNGHYAFEIPRERLYEVKIEIQDDNYYSKTLIYNSESLNSAGIIYFNETLEAKSWLTIILENPFVGPDETLNINKQNFKEGCEDCCLNGNSSFFETGDTTFTCAVVGGAEIELNYGVAGSSSGFNKLITCTPFDTTYFTIKY